MKNKLSLFSPTMHDRHTRARPFVAVKGCESPARQGCDVQTEPDKRGAPQLQNKTHDHARTVA